MSVASAETKYYHHGRFTLAGGVLPDAITAYRTYGDPTNPCIVFPTCYGGRLDNRGLLGQDYLIGKGKPLDPTKYYIVTFALFSNGESSSPSNTVSPWEAYYWSIMYPEYVESFLEGPKAALVASKDFNEGHYTSQPQHGIRAFGRVYSAWAYGQAWYRRKGHLHDGKYSNLNNFILAEWEGKFLEVWDANDMITLLHTWQMGDISRLDAYSTSDSSLASARSEPVWKDGDLTGALNTIKARALIMPCKTDLYFPPEDSEAEVAAMQNADVNLYVINSDTGHMAGGGSFQADLDIVCAEVSSFLES
ncbi:hypothetical protein K474DRAFT_1676144 [Panus rudis PR-1116 ss-1]|nr:hypothetical protein K474DRAFT_1676144 [Panus rudis PR-1116 ss-1]